MKTPLKFPWLVLSGAVVLTAVILLAPSLTSGQREISSLENLQGIPFPSNQQVVSLTEKVAHADIFLTSPVLAQKLNLTIVFLPHQTKELSLGLRSSGFWLSYNPIVFYSAAANLPVDQPITRSVTIDLTDKFQETDQSIDLMFFADYVPPAPEYNLQAADQTNWELLRLSAEVSPTLPTPGQLFDYASSLLRRERAA